MLLLRLAGPAAPALALLLACLPSQREALEEGATHDPRQEQATTKALDEGARMRRLLDRIVAETADSNPYLGDLELRTLEKRRGELRPDEAASVRFGLYGRLGEVQMQLGLEEQAIESMTRAYELLPQVWGISHRMAVDRIFQLGVAWLRRAEAKHHERVCADSCIVPFREDALYEDPEPARQALRYFLETLEHEPPDSRVALGARWLSSLAVMSIGEDPERVPEKLRIPRAAFASEEDLPRFPNIAPRLGVDTWGLSGGAIADDFDGDGYLDLVVSSQDPTAGMRYFHNERDGTFADRTAEAGLLGERGGANLIQADYDDDGDVDLLVLRGAGLQEHGRQPNSLLRNEGDGTFTNVTFSAGLGDVHLPTQSACFGDYDADGDLDLYVGNQTSPGLRAPCQLFRNEGDGTFVDVALEAGVANGRFTMGVVFGDYNGDDLPDLYVSNLGQPNRLYENLGDGTFFDVAEDVGVEAPLASSAAWFFDFDQDGDADLLCTSAAGGIHEYAADVLGLPHEVETMHLFRNEGEEGFRESGAELGLTRPLAAGGANFGDLDGDGFPDLFLGTGLPGLEQLLPNTMYRNAGGRGFRDVTMAAGFGVLHPGGGVVFADFDHDGDVDVFEVLGGTYRADRFRDALWENPGFGHRWLTVQCVGVKSNRSAIGTRLRVVVETERGERSIHRWVDSGGSFGANPLRQTIGLGDARRIVALEVHWPTSGLDQRFEDVPLDSIVRVREFAEEVEVLDLPSFRLGARAAEDAVPDDDQGQ